MLVASFFLFFCLAFARSILSRSASSHRLDPMDGTDDPKEYMCQVLN